MAGSPILTVGGNDPGLQNYLAGGRNLLQQSMAQGQEQAMNAQRIAAAGAQGQVEQNIADTQARTGLKAAQLAQQGETQRTGMQIAGAQQQQQTQVDAQADMNAANIRAASEAREYNGNISKVLKQMDNDVENARLDYMKAKDRRQEGYGREDQAAIMDYNERYLDALKESDMMRTVLAARNLQMTMGGIKKLSSQQEGEAHLDAKRNEIANQNTATTQIVGGLKEGAVQRLTELAQKEPMPARRLVMEAMDAFHVPASPEVLTSPDAADAWFAQHGYKGYLAYSQALEAAQVVLEKRQSGMETGDVKYTVPSKNPDTGETIDRTTRPGKGSADYQANAAALQEIAHMRANLAGRSSSTYPMPNGIPGVLGDHIRAYDAQMRGGVAGNFMAEAKARGLTGSQTHQTMTDDFMKGMPEGSFSDDVLHQMYPNAKPESFDRIRGYIDMLNGIFQQQGIPDGVKKIPPADLAQLIAQVNAGIPEE
jgi:hypothetical protein